MPRVAAVFARKKIWQAFSHKVIAYGAYPRDAMESKKCWHSTRTGCPWWTGRRRLFWPQALNSSFTLGWIVQAISFSFLVPIPRVSGLNEHKMLFSPVHEKHAELKTKCWGTMKYNYILLSTLHEDCNVVWGKWPKSARVSGNSVVSETWKHQKLYLLLKALQRLLVAQLNIKRGHHHHLAKKSGPIACRVIWTLKPINSKVDNNIPNYLLSDHTS